MMSKCSLIALFFLQIFAVGAQFNATFGFINVAPGTGTVDPGPWPQVNGLVIRPFTATGVSAQPSATGRFAFSNWTTGALQGNDSPASLQGSLFGLQYFEVCLRPLPGYYLQAKKLYVPFRRSGTGIRTFAVRSNADNFSNNLSASTGSNSNLEVLSDNVVFWRYDSLSTSGDQKGSEFQLPNLVITDADSLVLRIYAWNAEAGAGSFSIDNVTISGLLTQATALSFESPSSQLIIEHLVAEKSMRIRGVQEANWCLTNMEGKLLLECGGALFSYAQLAPGMYVVKVFTTDGCFFKAFKLPVR